MKTGVVGVPKNLPKKTTKSIKFGFSAVKSFPKPETEEEPKRRGILDQFFDEWIELQNRAEDLEDQLDLARDEIKDLEREHRDFENFLEALKIDYKTFEDFAKTGKLQ